MPNIVSVFKGEIMRLARKEVRQETEGLKKASALYRTEIADLKRRLAALEKLQATATKKAAGDQRTEKEGQDGTQVRFSAKRLAAQRQRLGLSAAEMGRLIGVTAQSVYNWEAGKTRPREQQVLAIASLRGKGKREISALLNEESSQG